MPAPTYESLCTDLHDAVERTINEWRRRNAVGLAILGEATATEIIDMALIDLTSEDNEDDEEDNDTIYEDGRAEPIGEEGFENSYIGGGGSPDLDNL